MSASRLIKKNNLGAEEMVEQLTTRTLDLEEKVKEETERANDMEE